MRQRVCVWTAPHRPLPPPPVHTHTILSSPPFSFFRVYTGGLHHVIDSATVIVIAPRNSQRRERFWFPNSFSGLRRRKLRILGGERNFVVNKMNIKRLKNLTGFFIGQIYSTERTETNFDRLKSSVSSAHVFLQRSIDRASRLRNYCF